MKLVAAHFSALLHRVDRNEPAGYFVDLGRSISRIADCRRISVMSTPALRSVSPTASISRDWRQQRRGFLVVKPNSQEPFNIGGNRAREPSI